MRRCAAAQRLTGTAAFSVTFLDDGKGWTLVIRRAISQHMAERFLATSNPVRSRGKRMPRKITSNCAAAEQAEKFAVEFSCSEGE